jgi:hypothetical protein
MQYEVTTSRNGAIAIAYAARQEAERLAAQAAADGIRYLVRPQADGTCLLVNGPKYENIWAFNRTPRKPKRKTRK